MNSTFFEKKEIEREREKTGSKAAFELQAPSSTHITEAKTFNFATR